ncbi:unknown [Coraliomargarita sp. CAG:312]|nr:unknown [Coraliomargarita sp. CAG:312]
MERIGIQGTDFNFGYISLRYGIATSSCPSLGAARFKRDIKSGTCRRFRRGAQTFYLRMRRSVAPVETLPHHSSALYQNRSNHRIRRCVSPSALCEFQCAGHMRYVFRSRHSLSAKIRIILALVGDRRRFSVPRIYNRACGQCKNFFLNRLLQGGITSAP